MPTVSIDYFFMGPSGQEEAQGVLPRNDLWIPRCDDLLQISLFQWDQEPAILALKQAVRVSIPTVEFVMEESPGEEHQSNEHH